MSAHQAIKNIVRRVPLIKFTHGKRASNNDAHHHNHSQPQVQQQQQAKTVSQQPQNVLEFYQIPSRYKRKTITKDEIDFINSGGPSYQANSKPSK